MTTTATGKASRDGEGDDGPRRVPVKGDVIEVSYGEHWVIRLVTGIIRGKDCSHLAHRAFVSTGTGLVPAGSVGMVVVDSEHWRWPRAKAKAEARRSEEDSPEEGDMIELAATRVSDGIEIWEPHRVAKLFDSSCGWRYSFLGRKWRWPKPASSPPGREPGQFYDVGDGMVGLDVELPPELAAKVEAMGFSTSEPAASDSPMGRAFRKEIGRVLEKGDSKKGGAFSPGVAMLIEKLCRAAREILLAEKIADNDISVLLGRKQHGAGYGMGNIFGQEVGDDDEGGSIFPLAPSSSAENFGAQAIRQLVEGLRQVQESPAKLVEALAEARKAGLRDVAASLARKLGIGSSAEGISAGVPPPKPGAGPTGRGEDAATRAADRSLSAYGGEGGLSAPPEPVVTPTACPKCGKAIEGFTRSRLEALNMTPQSIDFTCSTCIQDERGETS